MNYKTGILLTSLLLTSPSISKTIKQDSLKTDIASKTLSKEFMPRPFPLEIETQEAESNPNNWDKYDLIKEAAAFIGLQTVGHFYHEFMTSKLRPAININTNYEENLPFFNKREFGIIYYSRHENALNKNQRTKIGLYFFNNADRLGKNKGMRISFKRHF